MSLLRAGRRAPGRACAAVLVAAGLGSVSVGTQGQRGPVETSAAVAPQALLDQYCIGCHSTAQRERGAVPIALDTLDVTMVGTEAQDWERVVRKMRAGLMPPARMPRPDPATHDAFLDWLEGGLDSAAALVPNPGRTEPFHRLNRTEYRHAVRDLLAVDVDVSALLPADDASYGFDNIAGVLKVSPTLLERYLSAAQKVSRLAVGTPPLYPNIDFFRMPDDRAQNGRLPGLPFGTRGGTNIPYTFPMDAEYEISVKLARDLNEGMPLYAEPQNLEISIDGERVHVFTLPGVPSAPPPAPRPQADDAEGDEPARPQLPPISQITQRLRLSREDRARRNRADDDWVVRVPVEAGPKDVTLAFVGKTAALDETPRLPFERPYPAGVNIPETRTGSYLWSVEISGPYDPTGPGETPSRERLFTCRPASHATVGDERACARDILTTLARRAYRRPVSATDVEPLLAFYREGRAAGSFDEGIELALRRLLVSPEFLFRVERDPEDVPPGSPYPIRDLELASRLSFFLWSSIPDDELLDVADAGQLRDRTVLDRQISRMIADPKAEAFVTNFAGQWLFLRNLEATVPVQSVFPDFDDTLREGLRRETELFFDSIVREDRSALDLLSADYTFLNERVARHYGIPNVKGSHFRRVTLPPGNPRRGLLGHGSILTVTSYPDRTSPVVRGKWVLENLLGTPPPPPLPNVPELPKTDGAGSVVSMRERLAAHRANPVCASCHAMMDPLGFSLENFDAVGKWRTLGDAGESIDASGVFPGGAEFVGPHGLRDQLLASDRFLATLTEKMLTYALGRGVEYYDQPAVRAIVREAAGEDYRFQAFIRGIVESLPFQMRRSPS